MKTNHLDPDSLIGYVHRTIDDAQRENIDAHVLTCPTCRGRIKEQEYRQRQMSNELNAIVNRVTPSRQMNFAAIAPQLQNSHPRRTFWPRLAIFAPAALALVGLFLTLLGLWQIYAANPQVAPSQQFGAYPTLACFFFMLASVEQFDKAVSIRPRFIITVFVALTLWLGSAFIGLLNLIVIRDLAIVSIVALGRNAAEVSSVAIMAVMGGALLYIGVVIGGAEYHYRNIGQPGSWKLFSVTLLGQLFILILPYLIL